MVSVDWGNTARSGAGSAITPLGRAGTGLPSQTHGDSYDESKFLGTLQGQDTIEGQSGLTSKITPAGRVNNTVPTGQGQVYAEFSVKPQDAIDVPEIVVAAQRATNVSGIVSGTIQTTYYKMQGYFVAGAVYETWVAQGAPNSNPPSGHALSNIVVISVFTH